MLITLQNRRMFPAIIELLFITCKKADDAQWKSRDPMQEAGNFLFILSVHLDSVYVFDL